MNPSQNTVSLFLADLKSVFRFITVAYGLKNTVMRPSYADGIPV